MSFCARPSVRTEEAPGRVMSLRTRGRGLARSFVVTAALLPACGEPSAPVTAPQPTGSPLDTRDSLGSDPTSPAVREQPKLGPPPELGPPPWESAGRLTLRDDGTCWWQYEASKVAKQVRCPTTPVSVWHERPQPVLNPCGPGKQCNPPAVGTAPRPSNELDPRPQQERRPWRENELKRAPEDR